MIGSTLDHFRIDAEIGQGGMGVVYRARDLNLERDVAIKMLPDGALANDEARRRFKREALTLSRLNHPHIGAIYDFGSQRGHEYLVMELVTGQTLAERIASGALPEPELIEVGRQIADALETAHEQGVIHRDLKPGNVMLTARGQVKVLDFGLAKLTAPAGMPARGASLSGPQIVVGTLPYMAPEQLLGAPVDERSDLFALGAVLYEASTGKPPFTSTLATALVNEIVNHTPPSPRSLGAAVSPAFESVILHCLEKDPASRPRSASELLTELQRAARSLGSGMRTQGGAGRIESIAVLPLENLSRDPEQDYFADGMTEALISDLAKIGALRIVSRTSAQRYRGVSRPLPEIADELGVDAIVEGSVMRHKDRVRITARLIDASSDHPLWSGQYERDLRDVLAIQSAVAATIAEAIEIQLTQEDRARLGVRRKVDPKAYEAYLKGRFAWNRRTEDGVRSSIELFERAIELDPTYAHAYSGLADSYNILADNSWVAPEIGFARAKAAARRSLELEPDQAEANTSLAYVTAFFDWNWEESERLFRKALELGPDYPTAHQWYADHLSMLGREDEAIAEASRAIELDPLAKILYSSLGDTYYYAHRFDEAIDTYRRAAALDPTFYMGVTNIARALEQVGRFDEAIASYLRGAELLGHDPKLSSGLACGYAFAGRRAEAIAIRDAVIDRSHREFVPAYAIASIQTGLGEFDLAFEWLERALATHDRALVWMCVNPRFVRLRGDPRFADLARRVGLPLELIERVTQSTRVS